ncbi:DUF354 domain-containing protein [Aliiroseovarius subalbicans]|uniref:DUF354 domain-containing protein n=1 Tax=Aliiroseovarius subalbicans TaxID=2925840 RepID=UPI001F571FD2|nr:DUF354 domain-containing protein [Aliiroseovarius subalbicans]MCI2398181.1 DUF354 domain-containing protein [Aliiroseovarius subalbicans]
MRVLIDIVHPADVLFFKRPIDMFLARGDNLLVLSRHKDIACALLDNFSIAHQPVTTAGRGTWGLFKEMIARDAAVFRAVRRFGADVMLGFGGVSISHVSRLTSIPSVAFYDSENATLQTRLTWPFISHLYVPESYSGPTPKARTTWLRGTKDLSFLHPSAFHASAEIARAAGWDPERRNVFIRVVDWRANHDMGKQGWGAEALVGLIGRLSQHAKVHLSAEGALPDQLYRHRYAGDPAQVHHLVANCDLLIGESATMACEAAIMGVPGIYAGRDFPGYTRDLAQAGLIDTLHAHDAATLIAAAEKRLLDDRQLARDKRDAYVATCPDWAEAVVGAADRFARNKG